MRLKHIYIFISKRQLFIKNTNLKSCVKCINFIEHKTNYPYESIPDDKEYGKCKIFGEQNMVTGEIIHNYASSCRNHESLCGMNGKHFEEKL